MGISPMKTRGFWRALASVLVLWALTAILGVPAVVEGVERTQNTGGWGGPVATSSDSYKCYAKALAVLPLFLVSTEGCSRAGGPGHFAGGYESQHVHLWYLLGQHRLFSLWLVEE